MARFSAGGRAWVLVIPPLLAAALLVLPFRGYLTDDTFIYLQYARNLAAGDGFSFNPGAPSYGFTSPLWVLLVAAGHRFGPEPLLVAKVLGFVFLLAAIPAFWLASSWFLPERRVRWAALLVWSVNAWMLRWALSGLETPLAVCLSLLAVHGWLSARKREADPWVAGFLLGLCALTRPECLGLFGVALVDSLCLSGRGRLRRTIVLVAGAAIVLLPWAIYAERTFGQLLPNTVYAKGGSFDLSPAGIARAGARLIAIIGATSGWESLLAAVGAIAILRRGVSRPEWVDWIRRRFVPLAWTAVLLGLCGMRSGRLVSRYLLPILCWLVIFGFTVCGRASRRGLLALLTVIVVVQNLAVYRFIALPAATRFTAGLRGSLVQIGDWLRERTPEEATVGIGDIGTVGYFSHRRIIDLSGLASPEMLPLARLQRVSDLTRTLAFAAVARPDFLVDRSEEPARLAEPGAWPEVCEPLFSRKIGDLGIAARGSFVYTVYRMHWDRYVPRDPARQGSGPNFDGTTIPPSTTTSRTPRLPSRPPGESPRASPGP